MLEASRPVGYKTTPKPAYAFTIGPQLGTRFGEKKSRAVSLLEETLRCKKWWRISSIDLGLFSTVGHVRQTITALRRNISKAFVPLTYRGININYSDILRRTGMCGLVGSSRDFYVSSSFFLHHLVKGKMLSVYDDCGCNTGIRNFSLDV